MVEHLCCRPDRVGQGVVQVSASRESLLCSPPLSRAPTNRALTRPLQARGDAVDGLGAQAARAGTSANDTVSGEGQGAHLTHESL